MKTYFAFIFACFLAAMPARADDLILANFGAHKTAYGVASEFDRLVTLLTDEVLKDLVCRLSSERFTPERLSSALDMPKGQILRRINTLRGWGLVRLVRRDSATTIIERIPGNGERTLRRWAAKYCFTGESCDQPFADRQKERGWEAENESRGKGIELGGGGFEFRRKGRLMTLTIRSNSVLIELYDTPTADAIFSNAPFRSRVRTWKGGIYFSAEIQVQEEAGAMSEVKAGDLVYSAEQKTITLGVEPLQSSYGSTMQFHHGDRISLGKKSNIWGHAITDVRELGEVAYGDVITLDVAKEGQKNKVNM